MLVIDNSFYYYYNTFEENIYNLEIAFFFFNFATKYIMDNCLFKYFCNICKGYVRNKTSTL